MCKMKMILQNGNRKKACEKLLILYMNIENAQSNGYDDGFYFVFLLYVVSYMVWFYFY